MLCTLGSFSHLYRSSVRLLLLDCSDTHEKCQLESGEIQAKRDSASVTYLHSGNSRRIRKAVTDGTAQMHRSTAAPGEAKTCTEATGRLFTAWKCKSPAMWESGRKCWLVRQGGTIAIRILCPHHLDKDGLDSLSLIPLLFFGQVTFHLLHVRILIRLATSPLVGYSIAVSFVSGLTNPFTINENGC
jgi:hypothetical protein